MAFCHCVRLAGVWHCFWEYRSLSGKPGANVTISDIGFHTDFSVYLQLSQTWLIFSAWPLQHLFSRLIRPFLVTLTHLLCSDRAFRGGSRHSDDTDIPEDTAAHCYCPTEGRQQVSVDHLRHHLCARAQKDLTSPVFRAIGYIMSTLFYPIITFVLLAICISYWAVTAMYPSVCILKRIHTRVQRCNFNWFDSSFLASSGSAIYKVAPADDKCMYANITCDPNVSTRLSKDALLINLITSG